MLNLFEKGITGYKIKPHVIFFTFFLAEQTDKWKPCLIDDLAIKSQKKFKKTVNGLGKNFS